MVLAAGVQSTLAFVKESTYGTKPADGGDEAFLRRTNWGVQPNKDVYQSEEIRSDFMVTDERHGVRSLGGDYVAELANNSYNLLFAAALRKDLVSVSDYTPGDMVITNQNEIGSAGGDFIANGARVGQVIQLASHGTSANNGVDLRITAVTTAQITVAGTPLTNAGSDAAATITWPGKQTYMPTSSHTKDSFTFERNFSDLDKSIIFTGCHVGGFQLRLPATGIATVAFPIVGQDFEAVEGASAPHYTSPTAAPTGNVLAAVDGALRVLGEDVAIVTGIDINLEVPYTADPVVGSNTYPQYFPGRSRVSGQMTAYIEDFDLFNAFRNETAGEIHLKIDNAAGDEFVSIFLPKVKCNSANMDDGEGGVIQTIAFSGIRKETATGYDETIMLFQDSAIT